MKRFLVAAATVLASMVIAWAGVGGVGGDHITVTPPVGTHFGQGSSSFTADNDGSNALMVTAIDQASSCGSNAGATITAQFTNHPTNSFTFPSSTSELITTQCPAGGPSTSGFGIRRCEFLIQTTVVPDIAAFTQLCIYQQTMHLTATPPSLDFGTILEGTTDMRTTNITTSTTVDELYLSLDDPAGVFEIQTPCTVPGDHCVDTMQLSMTASRAVTVGCTPTTQGTFTGSLYIVANNGGYAQPVSLTCTGSSMGGMEPDIDVTPLTVMLSAPVGSSETATGMVMNAGSAALTLAPVVTAGADWTVAFGPECMTFPCVLQPTESTMLTYTFTPTATGPRNASFTFMSDDPDEPSVTVNALGSGGNMGSGNSLVLDPPVVPPIVMSAPVGSSATELVGVRNDPGTSTITATASFLTAGPFAVTPLSHMLPPAQTETFSISCTPSTTGTVVTTFRVESMDPNTTGSPIDLTVECTGTTNHLIVDPLVIDLGEVRIDGQGPRVVQTVDLSTDGPTLDINSIVEQVDHPKVTLGAPSSAQVTMGASTTFDVSFDPGDTEGLVETSIDVSAGPDTQTITFTANVVRAMIAAPADVDFGSVCIGDPVGPQLLKLASTGSATIELASPPELEAMTSAYTLEWVTPDVAGYPVSLATGEEVTIRVTPVVQSVAGTYEDHVAWTTDLPTSPRTKLAVRFVDDAGGVSPGALAFGDVPVRETSATQTVTVQNCAAGELTLGAAEISTTDFVVVGDALPPSLAPGAKATLTIAFVPQARGARMATLTIPTSAGDHTVRLDGTGTGDEVPLRAPASLYACDCSSSEPGSALVILLALAVVVVPRRRRRC